MAPSRNDNKNDALNRVRKAGNRRKQANRDIMSRSRRDHTTPETIDITNSDSSDDEDDIVMEDNQIMEFTLKRFAINHRVRSQEDYQPMVKFDFESNIMLLSFDYSKVNKTKGRAEIPFVMGDVQAMFYNFEMKDAAVQNNIDVDLDSFIYFRAEAERQARNGTKEYNFVLEFEEDEHFLDLIQAVEDSGILTPIQTQPEDIEINAKVLIEDSRRKYKLGSQATTQTTQSINKDLTPTVMDTSSVSTSSTMSQISPISLFNFKKASNRGSPSETAKIIPGQAIKNCNGPKVCSREVLDLRKEIKRLKEFKKRAKTEIKGYLVCSKEVLDLREETKRLQEFKKRAKTELKGYLVCRKEVLDLREETKRLQEFKKRAKTEIKRYLVCSKEVALREEIKRLEESEKMAKEEVKRAQDILLQAGAIIVDETNDGDTHPKEGKKATTRSLLVVQELRNKNEGLEGKVKNFEDGIDKAKKVLEQAWAIII